MGGGRREAKAGRKKKAKEATRGRGNEKQSGEKIKQTLLKSFDKPSCWPNLKGGGMEQGRGGTQEGGEAQEGQNGTLIEE